MKSCDQTHWTWLLLFMSFVASPASAFYNPSAGRWLSRDPIGERGGLGLYTGLNNNAVKFFDPDGLALYMYDITWWTLAEIQKLDPGAVALTVGGRPKTVGTHDVREYLNSVNHCYCANVFAAKEIEVMVHIYTPAEREVAGKYTRAGWDAIVGHEGRRKKVIQNGFAAFLQPAELTGAATKKCKEICRKKPGDAEKALLEYLDSLQSSAIDQYMQYHLSGQRKIDMEWWQLLDRDSGPIDGVGGVQPISPPGTLMTPDCPKSDCPGC